MKLNRAIFSILVTLWTFDTGNCQNSNNLIPFASGLTSPVCIKNAGDSRLFVVDQHGLISVVDSEGNVNPQPFLDIRDRVVYGGERGLLGVAFHPNYQTNGYFYVNYVGEGDSTHISRFKVSTANPNLADPTSELKLLIIFQPFQNHNGGDLNFGPDGFLYVGLGDGGAGGDPSRRAQNPKEFLGKMLRIDVDHGNPYAIPASNPFYNSTTTLPEIWALGLRNPWRFSFDRLTGDLWIADVGQDISEEIDFQPSNSAGGENYGWRCYEGNLAFNSNECSAVDGLTFPVYTYPHGNECSVTGGYVYRGNTSSPFYGYYFFADFCSDRIWTLHKASGIWVKEDFDRFSGNGFSAFGEDASGQIYIAGLTSGKIFKINDQATGINDQAISDIIRIIQIPYTNKIRIETKLTDNHEMQISVHDIRGVNLYQSDIRKENFEFDSGFLTSGVYIISVIIDGKNQTHKLIRIN